ncbi:hypothetical protein [Ruminococcus sp.]|uniref:hypothetical protein n=1 Tax=Ruminococcus sp. TaxID=41978 RepID=UPI003868CCAD
MRYEQEMLEKIMYYDREGSYRPFRYTFTARKEASAERRLKLLSAMPYNAIRALDAGWLRTQKGPIWKRIPSNRLSPS